MKLNLPNFSQKDPQWKLKRVGTGSLTFGSVGCAVCCVADILNYFGHEVTPDKLNELLVSNNGFADKNLIRWDVVAKIYPDIVFDRRVDEKNRYDIVDEYLSQKKPIIACIDYNPSTPVLDQHFFVFVGKDEAGNYLINDPMSNPGDGAYYLQAKYDPNKLWGLRLYSGVVEEEKPDTVENEATIDQYEKFIEDIKEALRCDTKDFAKLVGKAESLRVTSINHKEFVEKVSKAIGSPSNEEKVVLEALEELLASVSTDMFELKKKRLMEFSGKDLFIGWLYKILPGK